MISEVIMILTSFLSTNIDELCILILFFSLADTRAERRNIVIGEYLGVCAVIAISLIGTAGLSVFPDEYESLLGFIPISLGIKAYIDLWRRHKKRILIPETTAADLNKPTVLKVFLVILADGGDSIGIYISVFSNMDLVHIFTTIVVFMILTAFLCFFGLKFSKLQIISGHIKRFRHVIVPIFYIFIGILILFG